MSRKDYINFMEFLFQEFVEPRRRKVMEVLTSADNADAWRSNWEKLRSLAVKLRDLNKLPERVEGLESHQTRQIEENLASLKED